MNKGTVIALLGFAGVLFFASKATKKVLGAKSIRVSPAGVDLKRKTITIEILNPSSESFEIKSLIADVSLQNLVIATVDTTKAFVISGLGKQSVVIPFSLSPLGLLQYARLLLQNPSSLKKMSVGISGSLNVLDYVLPFSSNVPIW